MSQPFDDVFDRLVAEAGRAAEVQGQQVGPTSPVTAEATGYDERIRVAMVDGQVTELDLHPAAMRLSNAELADHLRDTVNAALKAYQTAVLAAVQENDTDFGALQGRLREIQAEAGRSMQRYTDQMAQMLRVAKQ